MLDYRDISLMESVPLMWGPVTASPVGIEPMTIFGGGGPPLFLFRPNTYIGTCMSIEHIYMRPSRLKKEVYRVTL